MKRARKLIAALLALAVVASVIAVTTSVSAAEVKKTKTSAGGITVHCYSEKGAPTIYYWNSLPQNIETQYPGPAMTGEGDNWYKYTFSNVTKINMLFITKNVQSDELTQETGEWWYKDGRWTSKKPGEAGSWERTDMREDSIYFVMTTRFYDGDKGNNVHCWADKTANNPDSDPAWRGDFKGLIQKLDYIKALGFSAIWITPVVENASGYDYHGYHAFDYGKVDPRYESSGASYQDLIDAAHAKGMKIVQDVVWNHTGNFGETFLEPMFKKEYKKIQDLGSLSCMKIIKGGNLDKGYPNYSSLTGDDPPFQARLDILKAHKGSKYGNTKEHYHRETDMGYETEIEQTGSMAGDCVDINTENPEVAKYVTNTYMKYVDMGVDCFRLDTEKHINRWTLNNAYFPVFKKVKNFYIFGEVCSRVREVWNHNIPSSSPPFFSWVETESAWKNNWLWDTASWSKNLENSIKHYRAHSSSAGAPTSKNAFLEGTNYHNPDYSKWNGTGVIDFAMHRNFALASKAWSIGCAEDQYMNDATWNVTYVDSHDYGPEREDGSAHGGEDYRFGGGTQAWKENLNLMFTWRGIPCIYYGSEVEFQKGQLIDVGFTAPLSKTGRAYFGD
ncbi:MAG: starch-binding protein [Ruminococcus sp.]|nr:starch-binding protein [Ruminococcus sp.]